MRHQKHQMCCNQLKLLSRDWPVSLGLLKILQYFGIQHEEVAGHSYGESGNYAQRSIGYGHVFSHMFKAARAANGAKVW
jgi:hypothetical protein